MFIPPLRYVNTPDVADSSRPDAQGGSHGTDIWTATRSNTFEPWSSPVRLGSQVNSDAGETRPYLSWDGTTLYFGTTRLGSTDIFITTREKLTGAR